MTEIVKTTITLTILHPADESPEGLGLDRIAYEIDEGGWLGTSSIVESAQVPANKVQAECVALGSDEFFFNV
jgi:hypothetical protein